MIPLRNLSHTGKAKAMDCFVSFCCGEVRVELSSHGVFQTYHENSLIRAATEGDFFAHGILCALHSII